MKFTDFFIRRPAFTIVLISVMTIIGLIAFKNLPIRWVPNISFAHVSIFTNYNGAGASLIENQITTPIESALSGIDGVEELNSDSSQGQSSINLKFQLGRNMDAVVDDVRSALSRVTGALPREAEAPIISKAQSGSRAIIYYAFSDKRRSQKEVSDYLQQFVIPRLQTVDGVALVTTYGRQVSAMKIWLDPDKMTASGVTVDDINRALQDQNIQIPGGTIRGKDRYYNVVTNESLSSAEQFNNLIIRNNQNQIIRLKNVAEAVIGPADPDTGFRVMGSPAVALGIVPQSTANPLDVAKSAMKVFQDVTRDLPAGMQGKIVFDETTFIHDSIQSVYAAVFEAIFCVLLVILLFLGSLRATLIPVVTIPICLITTFAFLSFFKFTINTITLMAFVLAIGLVVDDAIVMLENIIRHIENGMQPFAAAIKGAREIIFPIIAMTLTLAAVYTPIAFTTGMLGSIFCEFALTLAGAVIVSGVLALTLSPMMCARMLTLTPKISRYSFWLAQLFMRLQNMYRKVLFFMLDNSKKIILGLCLIGCGGYFLFTHLPSELAPIESRDEINVWVSAAKDASFTYTDNYVKKIETIYSQIPDIESYLVQIGTGSASSSYHSLMLRKNKKHSAQSLVKELNEKFRKLPGVIAYASIPPPPLGGYSSGGMGDSIQMSVMTAGEYKDLHATMVSLVENAKKFPGFMRAANSLDWDNNQLEVNIDREKAADLKVPMQNIAATISTLLAGRMIGKFEYGGKQYDIMMQMKEASLANPNIISQLYVRNDENNMISLADITSMRETTSPGSLTHHERMRSDTFYASLAPGYTIADGVHYLQNLTQKTLPNNMKIAFSGDAKNYLEANNKMLMTFLLALIFIYLVLVAQFESFIDPFIILLTVPFAVVGALFTLKIAGGTLNIYSEIGLVTLIGLIAKHGILITEFANKGRSEGKTIKAAVIDSALLRLRPILMTTFAMILGAMPLALAFGPGAETRHQIGWVIVGGLFIGTFFSLIVIPVAYSILSKFKKHKPQIELETLLEMESIS